jgi:hypothetical protein
VQIRKGHGASRRSDEPYAVARPEPHHELGVSRRQLGVERGGERVERGLRDVSAPLSDLDGVEVDLGQDDGLLPPRSLRRPHDAARAWRLSLANALLLLKVAKER